MFREMKRNWVRMGLTGLSLAAILAVVIVYGAGLDIDTECDDGYVLHLTGPAGPVKIGDTVTFTATVLTCGEPDPASSVSLSVDGGTGTLIVNEAHTKTWEGTADVAGLEGLVATATGGGGVHYWDVVVVEVASAGQDQVTPIGETITLTATSNPPGFEDMISWTGTGCLDNNDGTCIILADTAGMETYTAICGESSKTVDVTVVEVASAGQDQVIPIEPNGETITLTATTYPAGYEDMIFWAGKECLDNDDGTCEVPVDTAGVETYTATCGTSSKTVDVIVVEIETILVKPRHNPDGLDWGATTEIAVGAVGSTPHQADVKMTITPVPAIPYSVSLPVELINAEGYDGGGNATLSILSPEGTVGFNSPDGVAYGILTSSNVMRGVAENLGPCEIRAVSSAALASIAFAPFDDVAWTIDPPYIVPNGQSAHQLVFSWKGAPLDEHDIRLFVEKVVYEDAEGAEQVVTNTALDPDPEAVLEYATFNPDQADTDASGGMVSSLWTADISASGKKWTSILLVAYDFSARNTSVPPLAEPLSEPLTEPLAVQDTDGRRTAKSSDQTTDRVPTWYTVVRAPFYIPVLRSGQQPVDDSQCGIVHVYANATKTELEGEIGEFSIELWKNGSAVGNDVFAFAVANTPIVLEEFASEGSSPIFPASNYNRAIQMRIYMYEPGTYTMRVRKGNSYLGSAKSLGFQPTGASSFTITAVAAFFEFDQEQVLVEGPWNDQRVVFPKGQTVDFNVKTYIDSHHVAPTSIVPGIFPDFLNIAPPANYPSSHPSGTITATEEGDFSLPAVKSFGINATAYRFRKVTFWQQNGDYATGGEQTKSSPLHGMIAPLRFICPDIGIASIEAADTKVEGEGENEKTVHIVVFDDQKPTVEPAGQCLIRCEAKPLSKLSEDARAIVWDQLEWHIEDAGNVAAVTPSPPAVENDIVYPAMPAHNDGFGRKTLSLRFKERHEWTADAELELRFNRDGTGAANEHHASLANVAAGNPNWYVYWQQVANQFSHPASGTFGPKSRMTFSPDKPQVNGKKNFGRYHFLAYSSPTPYKLSDNPGLELITIFAHCEESIMECIKTIHHENGHRQSYELANENGGWGSGITYWWRNDVEVEELWAGENANDDTRQQAEMIYLNSGDRIHKIFEAAHGDFEPNRKDHDNMMDRHHADPPTATTGFCTRNENHVVGKEQEIEENDWSFVNE